MAPLSTGAAGQYSKSPSRQVRCVTVGQSRWPGGRSKGGRQERTLCLPSRPAPFGQSVLHARVLCFCATAYSTVDGRLLAETGPTQISQSAIQTIQPGYSVLLLDPS